MKKIKILGVLVFVIFVTNTLTDVVSGCMDGWNEADDSRESMKSTFLDFSVEADDTLAVNTLFDKVAKEEIPYQFNRVTAEVSLPAWYKIYSFCIIPIGLFLFYGFYCLIRLVISVTRSKVFTPKNVKRMRYFICSTILVGISVELSSYFLYTEWASQIILKGYQITPYAIKCPWLEFVVLALFTEIFAVGMKIKEEQDLTI